MKPFLSSLKPTEESRKGAIQSSLNIRAMKPESTKFRICSHEVPELIGRVCEWVVPFHWGFSCGNLCVQHGDAEWWEVFKTCGLVQDDWPQWGHCFQHGVSNSHRIPRSVWEEVVLKEQSNIAPSLSSGFLPGQVSPLLWCWGLTRGEQSPVLLRNVQDYALNKSIFFTKFSASRISL